MAELIDPLYKIKQNLELEPAKEYPKFIDSSEKIPYNLQNDIADYKRQFSREPNQNSLVEGMGEETGTWSFNGQNIIMLKLRLENMAPIYVPLTEIGSQYKHIDVLVGKTLKLAVTDFIATDTYDDDGHPEFVALGSVQKAEEIISRELMAEYEESQKTDGKFTKEKRIGVITDVIDTDALQMIFFSYKGISLAMYANDFYYRTFAKPLTKVAHIGDRFPFQITSIEKTSYEDLTIVEKNKNGGRFTPKGDRYFIRTTSLPFKENPIDRVKRLEQTRSAFIARIVQYNPIKGIVVEIAPGWWIKGKLSVDSPYEPSEYDAVAHTPVSVRIQSLNYEKRRGVCRIIAFPRGVARSKFQKF